MIKAIFIDLDGTMLPFGGTLASPATLAALQAAREAGFMLFISTGRHLPNIQGVSHDLFDGIISLNGQYCVSQGRIIRSHTIDPEDIKRILALLDDNPFTCAFIEHNMAYVNQGGERYDRVAAFIHLNMPICPDYGRAAENPVFQCLFFLDETEEDEALDQLKAVKFARWHPDFIDVLPAGGGKGVGVKAMLDSFGLKPENAMCIGDGENDISMLELAGTAVVMGQASDTVKSYADYVTSDVKGEGVYQAFRHFGIGDLPPIEEFLAEPETNTFAGDY